VSKVVVVVGASSGLGSAVAIAFAERGDAVVLVAREGADLEAVGEECRSLGAAVLVVALDVTDAGAVDALARQAVAAFGRIDVWVHLAAVALFADFDDATPEEFARVIDVNVMGYVYGARAALGVFRGQGHGVLLNVASIVSEVPVPALSSYVTSKFAVLGLGKALRADLRDEPHIHVCTVLPGAMDTPLWRNAANATGRQPQAPRPLYPVERIARVVVRRADRPRPEVAPGVAVKALRVAHRLAPGLVEVVLVRYLAAVMYGERRARSTGNLLRARPAVAARFRARRGG
jgi:NAD(P)-dependent dehydrogenase (short-subunit alcohol dehydrogenase family)